MHQQSTASNTRSTSSCILPILPPCFFWCSRRNSYCLRNWTSPGYIHPGCYIHPDYIRSRFAGSHSCPAVARSLDLGRYVKVRSPLCWFTKGHRLLTQSHSVYQGGETGGGPREPPERLKSTLLLFGVAGGCEFGGGFAEKTHSGKDEAVRSELFVCNRGVRLFADAEGRRAPFVLQPR